VEIHPPNGHSHPYSHRHQPGHSQLHGQSLRANQKSGLAVIALQVLIVLIKAKSLLIIWNVAIL
jgi:hypothetical protein